MAFLLLAFSTSSKIRATVESSNAFVTFTLIVLLPLTHPLGFFGGIGASSKIGILVKGSNYLEAVAEMTTIVFDKTGTLTKGEF